jgi:hypothetical protein
LIDALNQQKAEAVKAAQEEKVRADEQRKAAEEVALKACADTCVKNRTTRAKAQCQASAGTIEDYNKCR